MSKILAVLGATGNQGGSVANYVVTDPVLSKEYSIRAITRDTTKTEAQKLADKGIEVVKADIDEVDSLKKALAGAHTVFAVTTTIYDEQTKEREVRQGKTIADVAVEVGAKYLIFSTLSSPTLVSGGKYTNVVHFDSKYEAEQYIRTLPIKSAFFAPGTFMQNFTTHMSPRPAGDGTYTWPGVVKSDTDWAMIDIEDTGKYVAAILAEPEKFEGKVLSAATKIYKTEELAQIIGHVTGKPVKYVQVPVDAYKKHLPPAAADPLVEMLLYIQDFGYYGPGTKEKIDWTAKIARGKLTTFEEHVAKNTPVGMQ
ncbi:hypothetical protein BGW36DRAFT_391567 [Talaromyces proteolyticus]|uniref:NmrA-like domain-containing protein n=1 Tax=Talaromyces proteolyticus TaxID=1131652 RepID=A0AAD4PRJ5_9EURO|nr:uncharacterized protein BGW36DRAFT_391567 [Talaromyces proteolyticus]KAH8689012.1 hypothetical protein BGW36DRAFT_391567 [Talaromyces proteolyticus]